MSKIAVVGATENIGREILSFLYEDGIAADTFARTAESVFVRLGFDCL